MGLNVGLKMAVITDTKAKNIKPGDKPIAHGGVAGLRLESGSAKGNGKWILRFVSPETGKRRDMGLGRYPDIGIADVGKAAMAAREQIALGLDPIKDRKKQEASQQAEAGVPTFEEAARQVHIEQSPGWKNAKHVAQWITTLETYIFPVIGKVKVPALTPKHFADALRPIWLKKPETASRTKQRCHAVMAWCWAHGMVAANPVDVIEHLLPKQTPTEQHQPAMPWAKIPAFICDHLKERQPGDSTRAALEFLILTTARSGAIRMMSWAEVDFDNAIWTIPPEPGR